MIQSGGNDDDSHRVSITICNIPPVINKQSRPYDLVDIMILSGFEEETMAILNESVSLLNLIFTELCEVDLVFPFF